MATMAQSDSLDRLWSSSFAELGDEPSRGGLGPSPVKLEETLRQQTRLPDTRPGEGDHQLTELRRIGQNLAATLDLHKIYRVIYREIAQGVLGAQHLILAFCDESSDTVYCGFAVVDGREADPIRLPRFRMGGPMGDAIRSREARLVDLQRAGTSLSEGDHIPAAGGQRWPQSSLFVPMISGEKAIGVMQVAHHDADAFRAADVTLLSILASQAATAIENARLFAAEREQRILAEALRATAAVFSSTLNFDEVLDRILTHVGWVVPHDFADVMLVEGGVARVARFHGIDEPGLEARMLAARLDVAGIPNLRQMTRTGRSLAIDDTRDYPGWTDIVKDRRMRSYAGAPIRLKGLVVGFLNLYSARPGFFTAVQAERLQAFADQAAAAVENANLYGSLERYADELEQRVLERTRDLAEANDRLKELDRLKDQFISNVSHELRTPLANIKLYLGLLEHGRPEKRGQYLETLNRESGRLSNLIEELLELSRLDLGSARFHLEPVDVNALVAELVGDRSAMAADRGLSLDCQPDPELPPASGDPNRISQVITNLIANAINYTPRGAVIAVATAVRRRDDRDWVTVTVEDNGYGISPEELSHLFERFFRGQAGRASGAPGTGLGLAICKEIVERMEGQITVESRPGEGATFTVWLKPAA